MKRSLVLSFLAFLLVAGAVGIWIAIAHPFNQPAASVHATMQATSTAQIIHQPLPATDTANIQTRMNAPDAVTQSLAWIPQLRSAYTASVKNPLPQGAKLVIDPQSFWSIRNYGEVQATAGTDKYTLHLERFNSQWLIAWTTQR